MFRVEVFGDYGNSSRGSDVRVQSFGVLVRRGWEGFGGVEFSGSRVGL